MIFDNGFLEGVDENPVGAVVEACSRTINRIEAADQTTWDEQELRELMETAALVNEIIAAHSLSTANSLPRVSGDLEKNSKALYQYVANVHQEFQAHAYELTLSSLKDQYRSAIGSTFAYEFTQGDLERVQLLSKRSFHDVVDLLHVTQRP